MRCRRLAFTALLLAAAATAEAGSSLLYLEAQGVGGYSFRNRETLFYSMNPEAEMQKPSLGFDYLGKFSGESGDLGSAALQVRLAVLSEDERYRRLQPQVYNAWIKAKTSLTDVWAGHNRPALGIGSYFDSHGLLLRTLPIQGFGYDRDWGIGTYRDLSWGNVQTSLTTGTGMPVEFRGNWLAAARISAGVLNDDNWNVGISQGYGRVLDTMGYEIRRPDPLRVAVVDVDGTLLMDAFEHRFDVLSGQWLGESTLAAMYRLTYVTGSEGRVRIEGQPTWWKQGGERNLLLSACVSVQATPDLTARVMYEWDRGKADQRVMLQLYWYHRL